MYLLKFRKQVFNYDTTSKGTIKLERKKKPRNKTRDKGGQVVRGKLILDEDFRIIERRMWRKML